VEQLTGRPGVGEISLLLSDPDHLPEIQASLAAKIGNRAEVDTWRDVVPELAASVKIDETWTAFIVTVITLVVFLGIASAQLAAVLERRREFAVLAALGMKGGRLVRIMLFEGFLLGLVGGLIALGVGSWLTYLSATRGINFAKLYGNADLGISNILIDPIMYSDFGWWLVPLALLLSLGATTLSSLYPAWYAVRTNPADALRVDQ
jgi:ABC-type lipoprotein release transport system permease subunit